MNFLDRLSSTFFQCTRQYQFEKGQLGAGKGVSYTFNGMVDAIRTVTDDYLAIVNHSIELPTTQIEGAVSAYFSDYLTQEESTYGEDKINAYGQTFSQKLTTGPLAHITIIQQKSGPIELASAFRDLINKTSKIGLKHITETLIHPYSFLKNILWLSTFRGKWLHGPSPEYSEMFDISSDQIKTIFARPKQVETGINAVHQSGDLTGIPLPSIDHKFWDDLRYLSRESDDSDLNNASYMNKMHYHLIDLMLLNYYRCLILSEVSSLEGVIRQQKINDYWYEFQDKGKVDFEDKDKDEPDADKWLLEIYPKNKWKNRINTRGFDPSDIYNPLSVKSSSNVILSKEDDPFSLMDDRDKDEEDGFEHQYHEQAVAWKDAIKEWMKFINEKYCDKVMDSEE